MKILDCPAIGSNMTFKSPFFPQNIRQKTSASTAGFSVCSIISSHDRLYCGFLYTGFKCRQVGLPQILFIHFRIEFMAQAFRSAMYCKMFCTCCNLQIILIMSLKAFNISHTETAGKIRILTEGLMTSPPSRITENIDIGCPEGQALINICIIPLLLHIKFCTCLSGNSLSNLLQ